MALKRVQLFVVQRGSARGRNRRGKPLWAHYHGPSVVNVRRAVQGAMATPWPWWEG